MLFDDNDINLDFSLLNLTGLTEPKMNVNMNNKMNMNTSYSNDFLTAKEGFLRGNMFRNEYKPYKNLTYLNIQPNSDREAKLYTVMQYAFAINDMNLFLDTHPNDKKALRYLEELIEEEKKAKKEYMNMYGPLTVNKTKGDEFKWLDKPWPWEDFRGDIYV